MPSCIECVSIRHRIYDSVQVLGDQAAYQMGRVYLPADWYTPFSIYALALPCAEGRFFRNVLLFND